MGAKRHRLDRIPEHLVDLDRDRIDLEHPGLDLGEVEDVLDDSQQGVGADLDQVEILTLLRLERGIGQQLGHADDPVHRRPDLVAHVGEELAFRGIALVGLLPGRGELDVDRRPHRQLFLELQAMALHFAIAALDGGEHLVEDVDEVPDFIGRPRCRTQRVVLAARDAPRHLAQLQNRRRDTPLQPRREEQRDAGGRDHDDAENRHEADQPRSQFGQIRLEIDRADRFAVERDLAKEQQLLGAEHAWSGCTAGGAKAALMSARV